MEQKGDENTQGGKRRQQKPTFRKAFEEFGARILTDLEKRALPHVTAGTKFYLKFIETGDRLLLELASDHLNLAIKKGLQDSYVFGLFAQTQRHLGNHALGIMQNTVKAMMHYEISKGWFEKALELDPDPMLCYGYMETCRAMGQLESAVQKLTELIKAHPHELCLREERGKAAYELQVKIDDEKSFGYVDIALDDFEELEKIGAADSSIFKMMAELHCRCRNFEKEGEYLKKAEDREPFDRMGESPN